MPDLSIHVIRSPFFLAFASLSALTGLHAQTVPNLPDAGSLAREAGRSLQAPAAPRAPQAAPAKPMPSDAKAVRVSVRRIAIEGATLITEAELQAQVADVIDQSLTLAELEHTAQRIAEYYRQRGWYARVYLPQQDVSDGTIRIAVLEGRFGGASVQDTQDVQGAGHRADAARVQAMVTHRLPVGQPLSAADLERGLLIANDLPGIRTTGLLQAGAQQGETALALSVQDTPFVTGDAGLNNYGLRSTGRVQATGGMALNNMNGSGDQLALRLLAAQDIRSAVARYSLPLGTDGLRLAAHLSALDYQLGKPYKALDAKGKAFTGGATLTYPLIRSAARNLSVSAGYEHRRYDDDMLGQALRRPRINAATLGITGDSSAPNAVTWGGAQLTAGNVNLAGNTADQAQDAASASTAGRYAKLSWSLGRLQGIAPGWQVQLAASGQFASTNLASSERLSLGGPTQIRAYPINEGTGDSGVLVKLELQREIGSGWQAIAFYDAGRIRQHKAAWAGWNASSGQPNSYALQGAGLGLNWRTPNWQMTAAIAAPIGNNKGKGADGRNNDGSGASSVRAWLGLTRLF